MARQPSIGWACGWLVSAVFWSWVEKMLWFAWPFLKRKMKCACTLGSRAPATFSESAELSYACPIFRREKFGEPTRYAAERQTDRRTNRQRTRRVILVYLTRPSTVVSSLTRRVCKDKWKKHLKAHKNHSPESFAWCAEWNTRKSE